MKKYLSFHRWCLSTLDQRRCFHCATGLHRDAGTAHAASGAPTKRHRATAQAGPLAWTRGWPAPLTPPARGAVRAGSRSARTNQHPCCCVCDTTSLPHPSVNAPCLGSGWRGVVGGMVWGVGTERPVGPQRPSLERPPLGTRAGGSGSWFSARGLKSGVLHRLQS